MSSAALNSSTGAALTGAGLLELEEIEELADLVIELRRVAHLALAVQRVTASAPDPLTPHVPALDEVGDDPLDGALGDPDGLGDVAQTRVRVMGDAEQDLRVVGDEAPGFRSFGLLG